MIIDCDGCQARGTACQDCVVAVLIGPPDDAHGPLVPTEAGPGHLLWDADERRALGVLADAGLVPPLRLAAPRTRPPGSGREAV